MIAIKEKKVLVGTPTKTGTVSTMNFAKKNGWDVLPLPHSPIVPKDLSGYTRLMLIRDPYKRFISMFNYLHHLSIGPKTHRPMQRDLPPGLSLKEFARWLEKMRDTYLESKKHPGRAPMIWIMNLTEWSEIFDPDYFCEVGELQEELREFDVKSPKPLGRNNTTDTKKIATVKDLKGETLKIVNKCWAIDDCLEFGYDIQ